MALLTSWTLGDMAELLAQQIELETDYCEACGIVEVQNEKYCGHCANDIVAWLYGAYWDTQAEGYMEALTLQEGLS